MKTIFLIIALSFTSILFAQSKPKYFEGVVEYDITHESYMPGVSNNEIRERIGAKMRLYFKNGTYMREYIDGAGYTLRKLFYLKEKNRVYDYNPIAIPDTIFFLDAAKPVYTSFKIGPGLPDTVLGRQCASSVISAKYVEPALPDTGTVIMTYYFASDLPVNPDWHKDVYIWNDVIKKHKSIAIKFIEDDPMFLKQTFTAIKVSWEKVPDDVFAIDPKLIQAKAPIATD
jgi:hypothetical protein